MDTDAPEAVLVALSVVFLEQTLSPVQIELFRTVIAEAPKFPELGRTMLDGSIRRAHAVVASFIGRQTALGHLAVADPDVAATQLIAMLHMDSHVRLLLDTSASLANGEIERMAASCVRTFLRGALPSPT